jgi:hypothetical protein
MLSAGAEHRNVVRSYPGFADAMELIVGARLGFERWVLSRTSAACRLCGRVIAAAARVPGQESFP